MVIWRPKFLCSLNDDGDNDDGSKLAKRTLMLAQSGRNILTLHNEHISWQRDGNEPIVADIDPPNISQALHSTSLKLSP